MGMGGKNVAKWMTEEQIKTTKRKSKHSCVSVKGAKGDRESNK
jgi:hypothetical protein